MNRGFELFRKDLTFEDRYEYPTFAPLLWESFGCGAVAHTGVMRAERGLE